MFADDVKLFVSIDSLTDAETLQDDIVAIILSAINLGSSWILSNARLWCTRKKLIVFFFLTSSMALFWHLVSTLIGLRFSDAKLSFSSHIAVVVGQCLKLHGFIYQLQKLSEHYHTFRTLFYSQICSSLEYAVIIRFPFCSTPINTIEPIQRKFQQHQHLKNTVKLIDGFCVHP